MDSTNPAHSEKVNLKVLVKAFLSMPCFVPWQKKSGKCTYFATGRCFIHLPLIFATHRLILALQHIKLCITLLKVCGQLVLPDVMKDPLLIVTIILLRWSVETLILSSLRR